MATTAMRPIDAPLTATTDRAISITEFSSESARGPTGAIGTAGAGTAFTAPEGASIGRADGKGSTAIGTGVTVVADVMTGMAADMIEAGMATIVAVAMVGDVADTTGVDRAHTFFGMD